MAFPKVMLACALLVSPLGADSGRRIALVIGNDGYRHLPPLRNAGSDAKAVARTLEQCGFQVTLELDLVEKAMKGSLRDFKARIGGGDVAVFYFSGHGVQLGGTNFLLPVDLRGDNEEQVKDEAIPLQRVLDDLQDQKAGFSLAIVDACRNNPFPKAGRAIGGRGLAVTAAATGQMVLYSAGAGQEALDRLGPDDRNPNGLFTRVLIREMERPGVPVDQVLRKVREEVVKQARRVNHEQVPALYDQALGEFCFVPGPAGALPASPLPEPAVVQAARPVPAAPAPSPAEARLLEAMRAKGGTRKAIALARPLAAKGSLYGKYALGSLSEDRVVRRRAIAEAAKQGIPLAMVELAEFLADRPVSPAELTEARAWLERAVALGEPQAKLVLGAALLRDKLGPHDLARADRLLAESAQEDPGNWYGAGCVYWERPKGRAIAQEDADAKGLAFMLRGAELGDVGAMDMLATAYQLGSKAPEDHAKALRWYREAVERDPDPYWKARLGRFYRDVEDPDYQDGKKAVQWLTKAADKGDKEALCDMARMYRDGKLVPLDLPRAFALHLKAVRMGYLDSQEALGEMYEKGLGVPRNPAQAYFWYAVTREFGGEEGMKRLAGSLSKADRTRIETQAAQLKPS